MDLDRFQKETLRQIIDNQVAIKMEKAKRIMEAQQKAALHEK